MPTFARSQIVVDDQGNVTAQSIDGPVTVDRRYAPIKPTKVPLSKSKLDARGKTALIRYLEAEQGFAMRPFPRGHSGLTLHANGGLKEDSRAYVKKVSSEGISAKPGDRVVITDIKIKGRKIIFLLNGGPDPKHRFLRHIQLGAGPIMHPMVQDNGQIPVGARLTLEFPDFVPQLTGKQVEALIAPLISFGVKSPVQAFTDTLPLPLKQAILNHRVLVGMSTDMVLFAKGRPREKIREMDGLMPFEEWIYGKPPKTVEFVRINGNRVIRVEIAEIGKPPKIFTEDVVNPMMRTAVNPHAGGMDSNIHKIELGDVVRNPDTQAPAPPPSLRKPGEPTPRSNHTNMQRTGAGEMKPVHFPKQDTEPRTLDAHAYERQAKAKEAKQAPDAKSSAAQKPDSKPAQPATPAPDKDKQGGDSSQQ